jgi:hypothetical protein
MKIGQWLADCFLGGLSTASRVSFDGDRSTDTRGASYTRGASCDSKGRPGYATATADHDDE